MKSARAGRNSVGLAGLKAVSSRLCWGASVGGDRSKASSDRWAQPGKTCSGGLKSYSSSQGGDVAALFISCGPMSSGHLKRGREMLRNFCLASVAVVGLCVSAQTASAAAIYTENFESYPGGTAWADGAGTNGGWRLFGAAFDGGDVVTAPVFAGQQAGQVNGGSGNTGHIWNRFNPTSGSNLPTDPMWVEFFVNSDFTAAGQSWALRIPTTNNIGASRIQVGVISDNASGGKLFASGAALATQTSNFTANDGDWTHVVAEYDFNGAASTIKLFARQKAAGDTSPLNAADQLLLGGSSSATFSWNGTIADAMTIFSSFSTNSPGSSTFDNIAVYTGSSPIVPEPATLSLLMCAAVGALGRRK